MVLRDEIRKKIERKRQEIQDLETRVREAKVYVQALEDTIKMLPREGINEGLAETVLRPNSHTAKARSAILNAGQPLHVHLLVEAVGKSPTKANKAALSGSLAAYVRKGEIFTRPAPNTFGLIEMEDSGSPQVHSLEDGPPPEDEAPF
jgi:hypothetical protein